MYLPSGTSRGPAEKSSLRATYQVADQSKAHTTLDSLNADHHSHSISDRSSMEIMSAQPEAKFQVLDTKTPLTVPPPRWKTRAAKMLCGCEPKRKGKEKEKKSRRHHRTEPSYGSLTKH